MKGIALFTYVMIGLGAAWSVDKELQIVRPGDNGFRVFSAIYVSATWPQLIGMRLVKD